MKIDRLVLLLVSSLILVSQAGQAHGGFFSPQQGVQESAVGSTTRRAEVFRHQSSAAAKIRKFSEDSILVKFKASVADGKKDNLHKRHGSTVAKKFKPLRIDHVKLKKGATVEDALTLYKTDPDVEYAEPDYIVKSLAIPNDPLFDNLWGMSMIGAPAAWNSGTGSSSVVVAVIDTGIDYTHPDLADNIWFNPGINVGYTGDSHGIDTWNHDSDPFDDHFHGTHVAGTIGGEGNNGIGVAGVNWNVKLMGCKFLGAGGSGYISGAIECLQYVRMMKDQGVNIVATNNSWGGSGYSQSLADAISAQQDILFIAAAGNESLDIDKNAHNPGGYDLPNVITVAATDFFDTLADFSNNGLNSVHVGAPGVSIYSTMPGNTYGLLDGTSMATPHVTGLAALLAATGKDWKQTRNLILSGGDTVTALTGKTITGRRINAANAVTCADRPFFALQHPPTTLQAGVQVTLTAISINCAAPAGPVTVTVPGGGTLQLRDDGTAPDTAAGDGVFNGYWTPTGAGPYALSFSSPAGSRATAVPAVAISATPVVVPPTTFNGSVVSTNVGDFCSVTFNATGGITPFSWSIASGDLPAGLTLNAVTGQISGTSSVAGPYAFTLRVTDALGITDESGWSILVNQGVRPGWPKLLRAREENFYARSSSPIFADLDNDGRDEIIVGDLNTLYVFTDSGLRASYYFPANVTIFATPAVADLFNNGSKQIIITAGWPSLTAPIYVFDKDLNLLPGFPAGGFSTLNGSPGHCGSPVIADFNNDGQKTILADCSPNNTNDPTYGANVLVMVTPQGAMVNGWPITVGSAAFETEPLPVAADLYNDGKKRILLLGGDGIFRVYRKDGIKLAEWTAAQNPTAVWTPAVADFDGDGYLEIGVRQFFDNGIRLAIYNRNGGLLSGWPKEFPYVGNGGIIAADINGDGRAELITNTGPNWNQWNAFTADGSVVTNWPLTPSDGYIDSNSFPVAGAIGGADSQDLIFSLGYSLWGYDGSASPLDGFPRFTSPGAMVRSSPALGDLDGNGRADIAVKSGDGMLHVFESIYGVAGTGFHWPMYGHDAQHTGAIPVADLALLPTADFSASPLFGQAPLNVIFTDTSTKSPTGWSWTFGDGAVSSQQHPMHSYATPGTYSVALTVTNVHGSSTKTRTSLITAYGLPAVATSILPSGATGGAYSQTLAASGGMSPYSWDILAGVLPNGLLLTGSTGLISGTASASGVYSFGVRVTDALGGTGTKSLAITVNDAACGNAPVRIGGASPVSCPDFSAAYPLAADNDLFQFRALSFSGDFLADRNIRVTLKGGYDCGYSVDAGFTTLLGKLRVKEGTVKIDKLRLR